MGNSTLALEQIRKICEEHGLSNTTETVTFEEHYNNYLKNLEGKGSSRAFMDKVRLGKILIEDLGNYTLQELDIDVMSRYINSWTTRKYISRGNKESLYSQTYLDKVYVNLKCSFKLAIQKGVIHRNVLDDISKPISKKYTDEKNNNLSDEDVKMLISAFDNNPMWRTLISILAYTGLRPGEVFALKFSDFDYEANILKVQRALSLDVEVDIETKRKISSEAIIKLLKNEVNGRKDYARRTIKVSTSVIDMVKKFEQVTLHNKILYEKKKLHQTIDYLFVSPNEGKLKKPNYYLNAYKNELAKRGIETKKYNLYRFRHTYCTNLFKKHKLDPKVVQMMMGDNTLEMVLKVYNSVNKHDVITAGDEYSKNMDMILGV